MTGMSTPTFYTFHVQGHASYRVAASNPIRAMSAANDHFGCLPQGAWMDMPTPGEYRWAFGNFFD